MRHRPAPPTVRDERGKAAVIILALVAVAAIGFAVYWFVLRGGGGEASKLVTAHIPAEAEMVGGLDVPSVVNSSFAKELIGASGVSMDEVTAQLAKAGVKLDDLKTIAFGMTGVGSGNPEVVTVAKGTFDANAIKGAVETLSNVAKARAEAEGMHVPGFDPSTLQVLDSGVVVGGSGELFQKSLALAKGGGKSADDNAALRSLRKHIDEGASFWVTGPIPDNLPMGGMGGMGMLGGDMGKPTHFGVSADVGSKVDVSIAVHFDSGDAGKMASSIDGMLGFAKMAASGPEAELLDSLSVSGSGQVLSASFSLDAAMVKKMAEQRGGGMGLF